MPVYPVCAHQRVALSALIMLVLVCAGCSWFKRSDGLAGVTAIPLTPTLRLSPSITSATVPYQNACGQQASISIAAPLSEILPKKLGRVFTGLSVEAETGQGVIDAALGLKQIDLAITRQMKKTYPVTVTLGLDVVMFADDGTTLFSKKLQSAGLGEVEVTDQTCDVKGLEAVVREAVELVSEGMAKQVSESVRVREFAMRRKADPASKAPPSSPAGTVPTAVPPDVSGTSPVPVPIPIPVPPGGPAHSPGDTTAPGTQDATALTFRAILRDENRDQILQDQESLTIEVEVKNDGASEAKGVEVVLSGTPALTAQFPEVLPVGDVEPGEFKRTASTQRLSGVKEPVQGELVLSLRSTTPIMSVPPAKKFTVLIKPEKAEAGEPVQDVDQPSKSMALSKPAKAVVIAIGVGRFRDEHVAPVKYAGRDAEVMASYLRAIGNVPEDRVRVLIDGQALKQDLAETFDEWLSKRADANTVAYVYFAGRALVDGVTGAVSLVPFDGTTTALNRLYSVRRLQESLSRASIHRAILMFDVSLEPTPGTEPSATAVPNWDVVGERSDQIMWMVSHNGLQESHAYEQGRHGLFTYHLLKGLQGVADVDRDGTVEAGELCTYARGQVSRVAREQFGNEQDPLCLPPPGQGAMVRIHPLAKGHNPKPAPAAKKQDSAEASSPRLKSNEVGPGQ